MDYLYSDPEVLVSYFVHGTFLGITTCFIFYVVGISVSYLMRMLKGLS